MELLKGSRFFKDFNKSVSMHLVLDSAPCSINRAENTELRVPIKPTDFKTDLES